MCGCAKFRETNGRLGRERQTNSTPNHSSRIWMLRCDACTLPGMRNNLVFGLMAAFAFVFVACDGSSGGGTSGGMSTSSSTSSSSSTGAAGTGGMGGSENNGGAAGTGGMSTGGGAGMGGMAGSGGGGAIGALCGQSAGGAMCAQGLACCYPCGIPGCDFKCTTPCDPNSPGCMNGCMLLP